MDDRRSSRRWHTADYANNRKKYAGKFFGVFNRAADEFIGQLADISSEGMMVLSKKAYPDGATMKLRIELPEEIKGSDQLMVEARTVWCERDSNPDYHRIGFSFTYAFPHPAEILTLLFGNDDEATREKSQKLSSATN